MIREYLFATYFFKKWEETRDKRVGSWRDFVGGAAKKKRKTKGLSKLPAFATDTRNKK